VENIVAIRRRVGQDQENPEVGFLPSHWAVGKQDAFRLRHELSAVWTRWATLDFGRGLLTLSLSLCCITTSIITVDCC